MPRGLQLQGPADQRERLGEPGAAAGTKLSGTRTRTGVKRWLGAERPARDRSHATFVVIIKP
jgi:hypothetical protein